MLATIGSVSGRVGTWLGAIVSLGAIYAAGPFPFLGQGIRLGGAIGLSVVIIALTRPLARQFPGLPEWARQALWIVDLVLLVGFIFALYQFAEIYDSLWEGIFLLGTDVLMVGLFGTLVVIEMARRAFGLILPAICLLAMAYAHIGNLPGIFGHRGFSFEESISNIWFSFSGVFGRPTDIVSSVVLVFIVFGAMLEATGATGILLKLATALTARIRGGTAHSAIVASAMFGTISGSPVANVVGTGVFTIPMIRQQGFSNAFAGAVEAAASSGGQFTPPIMASVAFIMAELIGQPYWMIAIAAALPAVFYYFSLFASVYAEAVRLGIEPLPAERRPVLTRGDWIESLRFFVPLAAVVLVLLAGRSAAMAGFAAIAATLATGIAIDLLIPGPRAGAVRYTRRLLDALQKGGDQCAQIMVAVGAIGVVVAVVGLTGIAGNFAELVGILAEGSLFTALIVTALACIVLGMGLPTLPAYLFIVLFVGPIVGKLGIEALLVHMFVLYYAVLSNVTPPVAIAAYAAAPIAEANPVMTGLHAIRIAAVGFVIPFVMIYYPSLSLVAGFDWAEFLWILARLPLAVWLVATAFIGCDTRPLSPVDRAVRMAVAGAALMTVPAVQIGAFILGIVIVVLHRRTPRRKGSSG